MSSYAARLLFSIAADLNKPTSTVQAFVDKLEENWFDTRESLLSMKDSDFEKLQIPLRIAQLIKEKLASGGQKPEEKKEPQFMPQKQQLPQVPGLQQTLEEELAFQITVMRTELKQCLLQSIKTMHKILSNIVENPLNKQFYEIKLSSRTLNQQIMAYNSTWRFMELCGWDKNGEAIVLNQNRMDLQNLQIACQVLMKEIMSLDKSLQPAFNPYQASISSVGNQFTNSDIARREGYDVYSFTEQLENLKMKRLVENAI